MTVVLNPQMITLARQSRGFNQTQLAKTMGISVSMLSRVEQGTRVATQSFIDQLSFHLDYPPVFFEQLGLEGGPSISESFHRARQNISALHVHCCHSLAQIREMEICKLLKSQDDSNIDYSYPVDEFDDDVDKIARTLRFHLQLPDGPVFNLTQTLENVGYVVVAHDFPTRKVDGFYNRPIHGRGFFHLRKDVPTDRWRWTLAHELGHATMHFEPFADVKEVERQADAFAAEFLMPEVSIRSQLVGLTLQKAAFLKKEWKVSMQSIVRRARQLNVITAGEHKHLLISLSKAGYRVREPETLDPPEEVPIGLHKLARYHLDALEYSPAELADFLCVGQKDLRLYYGIVIERNEWAIPSLC